MSLSRPPGNTLSTFKNICDADYVKIGVNTQINVAQNVLLKT